MPVISRTGLPVETWIQACIPVSWSLAPCSPLRKLLKKKKPTKPQHNFERGLGETNQTRTQNQWFHKQHKRRFLHLLLLPEKKLLPAFNIKQPQIEVVFWLALLGERRNLKVVLRTPKDPKPNLHLFIFFSDSLNRGPVPEATLS